MTESIWENSVLMKTSISASYGQNRGGGLTCVMSAQVRLDVDIILLLVGIAGKGTGGGIATMMVGIGEVYSPSRALRTW